MKTSSLRPICALALLFSAAHFPKASASPTECSVAPVKYKGLVGRLYLPSSIEKVPLVLAFGGSDGGMNFADANGKMICPHGMAVLGVAYFKEVGLPPTLDQIPLEYFVDAIDYAQTLPQIDQSRIGVVSGSRGSEAALLLASYDKRIKSVVVTTPSNVSWGGMTTAGAAWTMRGKPIPFLSLSLSASSPQIARFEASLADANAVKAATIPIERINGPIFLVSAQNDQTWPSYQMTLSMQAYLKAHNFTHSVTHSSYLTGHMFSQESAPEIRQSIVDHFLRTLHP